MKNRPGTMNNHKNQPEAINNNKSPPGIILVQVENTMTTVSTTADVNGKS